MQGNQCVQESYDKDFPSFPFGGLQDSLPFHGIKVQILIVSMRLIKIFRFDLRMPCTVYLILSLWFGVCECIRVSVCMCVVNSMLISRSPLFTLLSIYVFTKVATIHPLLSFIYCRYLNSFTFFNSPSRCFSRTNDILVKAGKSPIDWSII